MAKPPPRTAAGREITPMEPLPPARVDEGGDVEGDGGDDLPALLPESLRAALEETHREGEAKNTVRSYESAMRYWRAWHAARYNGKPLALDHLTGKLPDPRPVPLKVVLQFIVDHLARRPNEKSKELVFDLPPEADRRLVEGRHKARLGALSLNTVKHRLSVLAHAHVHAKLANPCEEPAVASLLRSSSKGHAKRLEVVKKKPALDLDPLNKLLATCEDSMTGKRDRALLLFAWASGGRRRSEVAAADMKFLTETAEGFEYRLLHSKSNQAGVDLGNANKPITGYPAQALREWLQASGITEGPIFTRVLKNGRPVKGEALNPEAVRYIVRRRAQLAGLKDGYSAHSLRSGFMTQAGADDMPLQDVMAMSSHKSVRVALDYMRQGKMATRKVASLYRPPAQDNAEDEP